MPTQLLIEYLDRSKANYCMHRHVAAYTAAEIAEAAHIQGNNFAKVVMVKVDGTMAMVVLPAHYHVGLTLLRDVLAADSVELATEQEFSHRFPRCETGAMPPFGHLYGTETYMVLVFDQQGDISFNAGTHSEVISMPYYEYLRLAHVTEIPEGVIPPTITPPTMRGRRHRHY